MQTEIQSKEWSGKDMVGYLTYLPSVASRARRHDDKSTTKLKKSIVLYYYYYYFFNTNLISYDSQFLHDIAVFTVKEKNSNDLIQRLDKLKFSRNE